MSPAGALRRAAPCGAAAALALAAACHGGVGAPIDTDRDGTPASLDCDDADPAVSRWADLFLDADGDGVGSAAVGMTCIGPSVPTGLAAVGGDCAPADPLAWRLVTSLPVDRDGDGVTVLEAVDLCLGTSLPPPYLVQASGEDCDDADPGRAAWTILYPDGDGDGLGVGPRLLSCGADPLPAGFALTALDGDDAVPAVGRTFDDGDLLRLLD